MANITANAINAELDVLQEELKEFKTTIEYLNIAQRSVAQTIDSVKVVESNFNNKIEELQSTYDAIILLQKSLVPLSNKIDKIDFPQRLSRIEATIQDTIKILNETKDLTLLELVNASKVIREADFEGKFRKLQISIDTSIKSNSDIAVSIEKQRIPEKIEKFEANISHQMESSISELKKNTKQIATETAKSIFDLNLPIRFDKLDTTIAGSSVAIQNVQSRIESFDRSIGDTIKANAISNASKITKLQENLKTSVAEQNLLIQSIAKKQQLFTMITWGLIVLSVIGIVLLK